MKSQPLLGQKPFLTPYIRYSSSEQGKGGSEYRQKSLLEYARNYVAKNGLHLDEVTPMIDRGFSGYHGQNRTKGALGNYLKLVESGKIPRNSVLFVENIDRLSREGPFIVLTDILNKLFVADIQLLVRFPEERLFTKENINECLDNFLSETKRANAESKRKSELMRYAWEKKKEKAVNDGIVLTMKCPAWLEVITDQATKVESYCVKPHAQETIHMIFRLYISGLGRTQMEKALNARAKWSPPKGHGWRFSYIHKILENRSVLGEYQPHKRENGKRIHCGAPRPNLYPAMIDVETFNAAQLRLSKNKGKGGPTGVFRNVLRYLANCPYCGGAMTFIDKGPPPKGGRYLVCENGRRGHKCALHSTPYAEVENLVLENCVKLRPEQILPDESERTRICLDLRTKIDSAQNVITENKRQLRNLATEIGRNESESIRHHLTAQSVELECKSRVLRDSIEAMSDELRKNEQNAHSVEQWQKNISGLREAIAAEDGAQTRMILNAQLCELIEKIEIFSDGYAQRLNPDINYPRRPRQRKSSAGTAAKDFWSEDARDMAPTEDDFAEWFEALVEQSTPALIRAPGFSAFVESVLKRRMSKEGRFVRIRFKNGSYIDVAPKDSLAFRWERVANGSNEVRWESQSLRVTVEQFLTREAGHEAKMFKDAG